MSLPLASINAGRRLSPEADARIFPLCSPGPPGQNMASTAMPIRSSQNYHRVTFIQPFALE
jgi:hypothetical protein